MSSINREDTIEILKDLQKDHLQFCLIPFRQAIERVQALPSTGRPQGEWITEYSGNGWNDYWDYTCSNCGKKYKRADNVLYKSNFCPNCGAEMKGASNE